MHIGEAKLYIARGRHLEAVQIHFVIGYIVAPLVRTRSLGAAILEIILLEIDKFIGLAAKILAYMAGSAAIGLEALIALDLKRSKSGIVAAQPFVETAVGRNERLFIFGDCVRDILAAPAFGIDGGKFLGQPVIMRKLGDDFLPDLAAHLDRVHRGTAGLFLEIGRSSIPELRLVEGRVEDRWRVHVAKLLVYAFRKALVILAAAIIKMAVGAGKRVVGGKALVIENLFANGNLARIKPLDFLGQGLHGLVIKRSLCSRIILAKLGRCRKKL